MSNPFVGEISIFGFSYAPRGWALCNGQLLSISQNTALFSLLGTQYGGDGRTTFGLPNLQGCAPLHQGQGPGLSQRAVGELGGEANVTLNAAEMAAHSHPVACVTSPGGVAGPQNNVWAGGLGRTPPPLYSNAGPNSAMSPAAIGPAGGGQPHNNMPPFLVVNFCIALTGIFPARN